ncbi:MAG TPA: polysaccharide deacetylase family protein [Candidatus Kapabacteria bacterium]|nr:polysaccharide deacetylase family protein [Candidatus Kapabacteria bacterium]HRK58557.1 polysaccharide deacetylase family protein [Candidatus Kapabacteria bacterium]
MESVIFSIDVEAWHDARVIQTMQPHLNTKKCTDRVIEPTLWLLDSLDEYGGKATFFVLGRIAKKYPNLVKEIVHRGHEVGSHGFDHVPLTERTMAETLEDILNSKDILEQCSGKAVSGYRAPCFSLTKTNTWVYESLAAAGYSYDSSVFPFSLHPEYALSDAPLAPYYAHDNIVEFPLSCISLFGIRIPCGGGAYFRLSPSLFTKHCMTTITHSNRPFVFYIHPWELDDTQPRVGSFSVNYMRHYSFLSSTRKKLIEIFKTVKTVSFKQWIEKHRKQITTRI